MIQTDQVRFQYKKRDIDGNVISSEEILKGISLSIQPGEFVAILGKNGSGKSTFAKHFNAILKPSSGEVLVEGLSSNETGNCYAIRQKVGMVFQNPDNQMVAANVVEDVAFGPENLRIKPEKIRERVKCALKRVQMWEQKNLAPNHLSGGQKQRIAIAGVLAMHPQYVVLDEPTAMLDPEGRKEVLETLKQLNATHHMTVILITHDMEEAVCAGRVVVINDGEVRFDDAPEKLFSNRKLLEQVGLEAPFSYRVWQKLTHAGFAVADAEPILCNMEMLCNRIVSKSKQEWKQDLPVFSTQQLQKKDEKNTEDTERYCVLALSHVSYCYSPGTVYEKKTLDDVTIAFYKGEFVGMAGHTGSGKSTLIQLLDGLLKPTEGVVYFEGNDIFAKEFSRNYLRSKVGIVFQYPEHQMICDTVYEDVMFGPRHLGLSEEVCKERARAALQLVGLSEKYDSASPLQLSGGQKRRVAIAGVLAMHPEYMILDEPAAGLDAEGKRDIFGMLKRICREQKIGILLVSHSMEDLAEYADRVIVLQEGKKILDDKPDCVFSEEECLKKCGLDVPYTVQFVKMLRKKGYPISPNLLREDDIVRAIVETEKRSLEGIL